MLGVVTLKISSICASASPVIMVMALYAKSCSLSNSFCVSPVGRFSPTRLSFTKFAMSVAVSPTLIMAFCKSGTVRPLMPARADICCIRPAGVPYKSSLAMFHRLPCLVKSTPKLGKSVLTLAMLAVTRSSMLVNIGPRY